MKRVVVILLALLAFLLLVLLAVYIFALTSTDRSAILHSKSSLHHDGYERTYRVVTSKRYDNSIDYPLVVMLHGYNDRGVQMQLYSGMSNLGNEKGFISVYPDGLNRSWNGEFCCGNSWKRNVDDVGFISEMIKRIKKDYSIDASRVFVAGYSNGGLLTQKLLNDNPEIFAGGAVVMSGIGSDEGSLDIDSSRAPILFINGENDKYVPLNQQHESKRGFNFTPADTTLDKWKLAYGCTNNAAEIDEEQYYGSVYTCEESVIARYVFKDTAHAWPQWRLSNPFKQIPESSRLIWDFWVDQSGN